MENGLFRYTPHGTARTHGRAQVNGVVVTELLERNLGIPLGTAREYEYVLLYLPTRERCYVIVLFAGTQTIHTIFGRHYHLPSGVRAPTRRKRQIARDRYLDEERYSYAPPHVSQELMLT